MNRELSRRALEGLSHRGPDSVGESMIRLARGSIYLGFRRLAIIDLSPDANQPFVSPDERFVIVFNGEIYNFVELRSELKSKGHSFSTHSDTEVLVAAWSEWGLAAVQRFEGMFSIVVVDTKLDLLWCVRDAYGIKPFFYTWNQGCFSFASEVRSLITLDNKAARINRRVALDYLLNGEYDKSRETFFDGVFSLEPGHFLEIDLRTDLPSMVSKRWWFPHVSEVQDISFSQAAEMLRVEFLRSVQLHLRSDVRVAVALSGGLDSSSILGAVRKLHPEMDIHTFSYVAGDQAIDESKWINLMNLSTSSIAHKVEIRPEEFWSDLDDLILTQGEPFGSTSVYAQYRVYQSAREAGITVMLDGQGADELLAGYFGYPESRIQSLIDQSDYVSIPGFILNWSAWPGRTSSYLWKSTLKYLLHHKCQDKISAILSRKRNLRLGNRYIEKPERLEDIYSRDFWNGRRLAERLLHEQSAGTLVSLLRHADRNSMKWSIESRVPFLNGRLTELILSLPERYLLSERGETKSVFREAMRGIVHDEILNRKDKIGLATPQRSWVNQNSFSNQSVIESLANMELVDKDVAHEYLTEKSLRNDTGDLKWRMFNLVKWQQVTGVQA